MVAGDLGEAKKICDGVVPNMLWSLILPNDIDLRLLASILLLESAGKFYSDKSLWRSAVIGDLGLCVMRIDVALCIT